MIYNLDYLSKKNYRHYKSLLVDNLYSKRNLSVSYYYNAILVPNQHDGLGEGVFDSLGKYVPNSNLHEALKNNPLMPNDVSIVSEKKVIYIGDLYSCFGHSLIDNLKKIWFLKSDKGRKLLSLGYEIVYLSFYDENLSNHVFRIFDLAGFNLNNAHHIRTTMQFRMVVIPDDSVFIENEIRYYTDEFKSCINHIIEMSHQLISVPIYDKIYLSRTLLSNKEDFGEKKIEELFASNGFVVLHPEKYSIEEQVCYLNQCKCLATTLGSISHLSMFTPPMSKIIILLKNDYLNTYQTVIDAMNDTSVIYVNAHHTYMQKNFWDGPFYLDITNQLSRLMNIRFIPYRRFFEKEWYSYLKCYIKSKYILLKQYLFNYLQNQQRKWKNY